jgi:flagellar basal body-associated protein FliL
MARRQGCVFEYELKNKLTLRNKMLRQQNGDDPSQKSVVVVAVVVVINVVVAAVAYAVVVVGARLGNQQTQPKRRGHTARFSPDLA